MRKAIIKVFECFSGVISGIEFEYSYIYVGMFIAICNCCLYTITVIEEP